MVLQMIHTKIVDLYQFFGKDSQGASGGKLRCMYWKTPDVISGSRIRPGVLILPGGGYGHVSPRESEPVAARFLARGYGVFILEYSIAPRRFPAQLQEAAMAMVYLRQRSEDWEIGPIAAVGFSAGGHLCGTLGTMFDGPEVMALGLGEGIRPDALGLCYPVVVSWGRTHRGTFQNLTGGDAKLTARLSLETLVRPDMPPVFLWHTQEDPSVPVRNSLILASALEEKQVPFSLRIYPKGPHGLSTADIQAYPRSKVPKVSGNLTNWPEDMMDFLEEIGFLIVDSEEKPYE